MGTFYIHLINFISVPFAIRSLISLKNETKILINKSNKLAAKLYKY